MHQYLSALFNRYAGTHLVARAPGLSIREPGGRPLGHVDLVEIRGNRLRVAGWTLAAQVEIRNGQGSARGRPSLIRTDVAASLSLPPDVGFDLNLPYDPNGVPWLFLHMPGNTTLIQVLDVPDRQRARQRLKPRFLVALLLASPAAVMWRLTHNPAWRRRVKDRLGLTALGAGEAMRLDNHIYEAAAKDLPPPRPVPITIVLPIYNAFDLLEEVLDRIERHTDLPWRLIAIEDCSSDDRVRPWLRDRLTRHDRDHPDEAGRIEVIENPENLGFIRSVNAGLARAISHGDHVVLLNSDAFLPKGWASRLLRPLLVHPKTASVTPMSNDAEIFSVPSICTRTVLAPGQGDEIDTLARRFDPEATLAEVPTGVGFCMAMHIEALRDEPTLDTVFGRGYGEEVDWCRKQISRGRRHLGLPGLFVEHRGGESFGSEAKLKLVATNNAVVARRYPGYDSDVQRFIAEDVMRTPRLLLGLAWAGSWRAEDSDEAAEIPVYLGHSLGGGAEHWLARQIDDALEETGRPSVVLRVGGGTRWRIELHTTTGVTAGLTDSDRFVEEMMAALPRRRIIYSCAVGDPDPVSLPGALLRLAGRTGSGPRPVERGMAKGEERTQPSNAPPITPDAPIEILFHDFYPLSSAYTLLDTQGRYRGPEALRSPAADQTPADQTAPGEPTAGTMPTLRRPDGSRVGATGWRAAWTPLLTQAARLVVFSNDSRRHVEAAYPELAPKIEVRPHLMLAEVPQIAPLAGPRRIAVLGNISYAKGAGVVRDLALRLSQHEDLSLVLIGNIDPTYALPPDVAVHGNYALADLPGLVARYGLTDWLIPSIWPETFSYATHEALATGMPVWGFAIGAQGEALAQARNGRTVPFDADSDLALTLFKALLATPPADTSPAAGPTAAAPLLSRQKTP